MVAYLEFEKAIEMLENKNEELKTLALQNTSLALEEEIKQIEKKVKESLASLYASLTPWQKTQVARHPERPHARDYLESLISRFQPLAGDRKYAEDNAIITGLGWFNEYPVLFIGQEKGHDTESRLFHNFGMARPEGYRKVVRLMNLANKFSLPVLSFVDTSGAYPGIGAEERGQAEAIARSTQACLNLDTPMISVIIGEGGSGGAISIATANKVFMLEHAIYSVASPEASASILWKDSKKAADAASSMAITAQDLKRLKLIDGIIEEPPGGAHRYPEKIITRVSDFIAKSLHELLTQKENNFKDMRREKFLQMGRDL